MVRALDSRELDRLPYYRCTLAVFASLCKMSMRDFPPGPQADQKFIKHKRLILELISHMVSSAGPAFRGTEKFVHALRSYLCVALVKNCVSSVPKIFSLSFAIYLCLISHFQEHLKAEAAVFLETTFALF
ncbi:unnamed protein product [Amoebophrya sp. A25]|nr:unnamed protein product [Amoebophrya sp. A25]|eukprot:GSA25T00005709001.1